MKKMLPVFPLIILVVYIAACHKNASHPELIRIPSLICLLMMAPLLTFMAGKNAASPIDLSMGFFLALGTATYWLLPENVGRVVSSYSVPLLYGVFFMTATVPLLLGWKPFTIFFSLRSAPPQMIGTPLFNTINRRMTLAWAGIFLASAVAAIVPNLAPELNGRFAGLMFRTGVPMAIMLGVGMPLVKYYPDYYQRKELSRNTGR